MAGTSAAQVYQPGFRTLGVWMEEPALRMDLAVWYPSLKQPKEVSIPPWTFSAALNSKPAEGHFPLIILSHATPADRFAYHDLASFLAREGFIVAAPTHNLDCMHNMDNLFTWAQLETRVKELKASMDTLLKDQIFSKFIDPARTALIGFGSGADAALLLGGALPNCANWDYYRQNASAQDAYMTPWAKDRINKLCQSLPLTNSLADPRFKAIALIAPGYGMLFNKESFIHLYPPVLLVCVGKDIFNQTSLHCGFIAKLLGDKARLLNLAEADTGALISQCSESLIAELPELCNSVSKEQRQQIHYRLNNTLLAFFRHYLLITGNIPAIPNPPNLQPEEQEKTVKTEEQKKTRPVKKRRAARQ